MEEPVARRVRSLRLEHEARDLAGMPVEQLFDRHPGQIACFMLEPERTGPAARPVLHVCRAAEADGALLVFDENVTSFVCRDDGGAQAAITGSSPISRRSGREWPTASPSRRSPVDER